MRKLTQSKKNKFQLKRNHLPKNIRNQYFSIQHFQGVCGIVALWLHFSTLASFCWLLSYTLLLGNEMRTAKNYYLDLKLYNLIGWMVPACIVCITAIWRYTDYRDPIPVSISLRKKLPLILMIIEEQPNLHRYVCVFRTAIMSPIQVYFRFCPML